MIAVLDLGIGNLSSVRSGFARAGAETIVVETSEMWNQLEKDRIDGVVLPGVGAFGDAMFQLRATGLMQVVKKAAKQGLPVLGICLGMQLLCSLSEEHGNHVGLGLIPGRIGRFKGPEKVPHIGWNDLVEVASHPLLNSVDIGDYVYFVHSYYAQMQEDEHLLAAAQYGDVRVPAVIGKDNVCGTQFHPEKSGRVGEQILRNFTQMCSEFRQSEVQQ